MLPLQSGDLLRGRLLFLQNLSYRISSTVSWGIVMHTMCSWNILLCGRISVHIMRSRDVLEYHWIVDMHGLSYRIVIISWRIVLHTLCERYLLLYGRISVHSMRSRDVQCGWIIDMLSLSERINIVSWCIVLHTL